MANLNKVMLIGRLTREPEFRTFSNGGRVAKVGFAVNNFKKNPQTGERIEDAVFLDCEVFDRGEYKLTDIVERYLHKGSQAYFEGHMKLDQWDDKTSGEKRSKLKVVVEVIQLLDPKQSGEGGAPRASAPARPAQRPASMNGYEEGPADSGEPPPSGGGDDIPF